MIIGAIVVVKATNIPARVVAVRANDTLDVVVKGTPERVNVKRSAVRWPSAHDRDKGAVKPGLGFFLGACAAAALVYAAMHLPHKADAPHVTPTPTPAVSIDFDHAQGYVSLPDYGGVIVPDCGDDVPPCLTWEADGWLFVRSEGDARTLPATHTVIKLALSFDGMQRYWLVGV